MSQHETVSANERFAWAAHVQMRLPLDARRPLLCWHRGFFTAMFGQLTVASSLHRQDDVVTRHMWAWKDSSFRKPARNVDPDFGAVRSGGGVHCRVSSSDVRRHCQVRGHCQVRRHCVGVRIYVCRSDHARARSARPSGHDGIAKISPQQQTYISPHVTKQKATACTAEPRDSQQVSNNVSLDPRDRCVSLDPRDRCACRAKG